MAYAVAEQREGRTAGSGWILFSAIVLVTVGVMRIIDAFWAFDRDEVLDDVRWSNYSMSTYGWIWLVVGILLVCAGFAVLSGAQWARWFGICTAALAAVSSMLWIYQFPIWSMLDTLVAFLVIYGLAAYGDRGIDA
jgi:hypothetical protein